MAESLFSKFKEDMVNMLSVKDHKGMLQPKRRRDASWFKDKVLLVQAQVEGKELDEEQLAFLADPGFADAKAILMANLSSGDSDVLSEVPYFDTCQNDMMNQKLSEEQTLWLQSYNKNSEEPSTSNTPINIEVPSELPEPLVDGHMEEVGNLSLEAMEDEKWPWWIEFLRVHLGYLVMRLGLEVEGLVDAMEVMVVDDK
nr:hypothetical protein [Tanacetum cinerariifolium]